MVRRWAAPEIDPQDVGARPTAEPTEYVKMINGLIRYRAALIVKEGRAPYDDPFEDVSPLLEDLTT